MTSVSARLGDRRRTLPVGLERWANPEVLAVAALTLLALGLRLPDVGDSLTLDEPHTWLMATGSLGDLFDELRTAYEIHPPLYFLFAWALAQLGDPTLWIRIPSLVLGTAVVPITYFLGRATVGRLAGAFAAACLALSPFAIHFSVVARPYATLWFFVALSTLALVHAVRSGGRRRPWVLYAVCASAMVYTHYFAFFVLVAQGAWALWTCRARLRTVVVVYGAVGLSFVPWLPILLDQPRSAKSFTSFVSLSLDWIYRETLVLLPGNGYVAARHVPGGLALIAFGLALGLVLAMGASSLSGRRRRWPAPGDARVLLALLALTTPLGLLIFSIAGENIWTARYLGPALPAILLLVGAVIAAIPPQLAVGATAAILGVLAIGTGKSFEARYSRADYQGAARFIESMVTPRDVVLDFFLSSERPSERSEHISPIGIEYKERHRNLLATPRTTARIFGDPPDRGRVVVAGVDPGGLLRLPQPPPESGLCLIRQRSFAAGEPVVEVRVYAEAGRDEARRRQTRLVRRGGSEVVALSSGVEVPVERAAVVGTLETVRATGGKLTATGWALDESRRPAGCVLVFVGGRLLGGGPPTVARADVAKSHGPLATSSGFELSGAAPRGVTPEPRAFAVADGRAAELEAAPGATGDSRSR